MALVGLVAALLGIAGLYHFVVYPLFLSPIANIPAVHPLAKVPSLFMLWTRFRGNENATVFAAHQRHGEVVRLGPDELSVNCIDDGIKTVYGKNFDRHYFYRVYEDCGRENLSSSLDAYSYAVRKRRVTHIYHKSYLQSSPPVAGLIDRIVRQKLLSIVAGYARQQQPFDTMDILPAFALDMVTGYTFGLKHGKNFLDDREEHAKCIREIHNGRPYETLFWLHEFPQTVGFLERVGILSKARYQSLEALHVLCVNMCIRAETALAEGNAAGGGPEEFPTVYQQFEFTLDKEGLSATPLIQMQSDLTENKILSCSPQQLEIAAEVGDQIHASDETLSITLTYAIWELSCRPDMQERLRKECQDTGASFAASSTSALPAAHMIDATPFLHAIVMETLRVHPVVAGGQARVTPHGKLSKLGSLPGSERWLQLDPTGLDQKYRWFWTFSSGARMCLGSNFALLVMKYVLALLYISFQTYIVNGEGIEHMNGYVGGPKSGRLLIGARSIARDED